ncbi:MAG: tyrosine-type recombinase/integrase [Clostridia bacterium]
MVFKMKVILDEFIAYLEKKHSTKNTITSYERDILKFIDYIESKGENILKLSSTDMQEYIDYLKEENKSPATISRCNASIKSFYKFLISRNFVEKNIVNHINMSKVEKKDPSILTKNEIAELLNQPLSKDLKGERDKTMLEVLYCTGIRVTELIDLNVNDVNFSNTTIKISKPKTSRIIKLNNSTIKYLTNYVLNIRPLLVREKTDDTLFLNASGKQLTRQGFWKILKQYKSLANIDKDVTPHTIRHSFAVHQLKDGMDMKKLQEILGHTDVATTMMYNNIINNDNIEL